MVVAFCMILAELLDDYCGCGLLPELPQSYQARHEPSCVHTVKLGEPERHA